MAARTIPQLLVWIVATALGVALLYFSHSAWEGLYSGIGGFFIFSVVNIVILGAVVATSIDFTEMTKFYTSVHNSTLFWWSLLINTASFTAAYSFFMALTYVIYSINKASYGPFKEAGLLTLLWTVILLPISLSIVYILICYIEYKMLKGLQRRKQELEHKTLRRLCTSMNAGSLLSIVIVVVACCFLAE